tara:strand:- start:3846 stop:5030 length:1185 start_codon:yes stop_codon:yes gene_type:complete
MKMINKQKIALSSEEKLIHNGLQALKSNAGSHSPSIINLLENFPEVNIEVDACFLSNPYATDLFLKYLKKDVLEKDKLREILEYYPSQNQVIAKSLATALKVDKENLFISNGAIEAIQAIIHKYSKKIVLPIPTFSSYYEFITKDTEISFFKLNKEDDYKLDIDKFLNFVKFEKPDTVIIINPNNPTGNYIKQSEIKRFLEEAPFIENLIIDESFIPFAYEEDKMHPISIMDLVNEFPNLVVIKSMSKDFGIAGIRAGYSLMAKEKVMDLLSNGYLWNINGLAEYFLNLFASDTFQTEYEPIRKQYLAETQVFFKELSKIKKIKVLPSLANFLLVELPKEYSAETITSLLLIRYGIYVRNCDDKIGLDGNYLRVASRNIKENELILKVFKELFS